MQVNYQYASPSLCSQVGNQVSLRLSPDLSREEKVSFVGKLKHPLIFRDAMLILREIVISDSRIKKKDYSDFFTWLNQELDNRMGMAQDFTRGWKKELINEMKTIEAKKSTPSSSN